MSAEYISPTMINAEYVQPTTINAEYVLPMTNGQYSGLKTPTMKNRGKIRTSSNIVILPFSQKTKNIIYNRIVLLLVLHPQLG